MITGEYCFLFADRHETQRATFLLDESPFRNTIPSFWVPSGSSQGGSRQMIDMAISQTTPVGLHVTMIATETG